MTHVGNDVCSFRVAVCQPVVDPRNRTVVGVFLESATGSARNEDFIPLAVALNGVSDDFVQRLNQSLRWFVRRHHFTFTRRPLAIVPSAYQVCGAG